MIPPLLDKISEPCTKNTKSYSVDQKVTKQIVPTYGEMLPEGIDQLIKTIKVRKSDVFYDLGSGTGRFCLQVYLTKRIKCVGIEYVKKRHQDALKFLHALKTHHDTGDKVVFLQGDFFKKPWHDATILYMCNLCFESNIDQKIVDKALKECANLRRVICIKAITHPSLKLANTLTVPSSWSQTSMFYVYTI